MATTQKADTAAPQTRLPRRIAFKGLVVLLSLVMIVFGGRGVITGWFSTMDGGIHRWHELAWGAIEGVIIFVGLAASLWRTRERVAGMQQAFAGCLAIVATMLLAREFDPFTAVFILLLIGAALLHPARGELLALRGRVDPAQLGLAAVAAVPLVLYALNQMGIHHAAPMDDPHAPIAHYAGTTAAALGIPLVAAVAALRTRGSAIPRWSAAAAAALLGLGSIVYPHQDSSFGPLWGTAAIVWGLTFVLVGRRADGAQDRPVARGSWRGPSRHR